MLDCIDGSLFAFFAEGVRYLDVHSTWPTDVSSETKQSFNALRVTLLLNAALSAIKAPSSANANIAVNATTKVLSLEGLTAPENGLLITLLCIAVN